MGLLFIHDHRFKSVNGKIYSNGGLSNEILKRYTDIFGDITVGARIEEVHTINNHTEITMPNVTVLSLFSDIRELENQIKKAEYIIVRLPSKLGIVSMKYIKKFKKSYLIELVGCPWDAYWNHGFLGKLIAPLMWFLTKNIVKKAPYVLYVSEKFLQKRYPTEGETLACSDVKLEEIQESVINHRIKKIEDKKDEFVIGTVGAANVKYKGQQYVIKAISKLKKEGFNIKYKIVGGGDGSFLKSVAMKYKVVENVESCGAISHEDIFGFMDSIDLYIQPSLLEGLPRSVIEAMSRGCPVLGTNVGGIPELVDDNYLFAKKDVNDICAKLRKIIAKKELILQAKRSFLRAQDFETEKLDIKRTDFYNKMKEVK